MNQKKEKGLDERAEQEEQLEQSPNETNEAAQTTTEASLRAESVISEETDWKDKYMRLYAEFDNYRKRTARERNELIATADAQMVTEILPVLDDLERALNNAPKVNSTEELAQGIDLVFKKLLHNLKMKGLEAIESKGTTFDPDLHEAITTIPALTSELKGKVVDEIEKGYRLNGRLIRFAKVIVGQ